MTLIKAFGDFVNMSRLPLAEPGVFTESPIDYPAWKAAFKTLIEGRNVPSE